MGGFPASYAFDGNTASTPYAYTAKRSIDTYVAVDLEQSYALESVKIYPRNSPHPVYLGLQIVAGNDCPRKDLTEEWKVCPDHPSENSSVIFVFLQKYLYLHPAYFGTNCQVGSAASFAAGSWG